MPAPEDPNLIASRFAPNGTNLGRFQPATDTILQTACLLLRIKNGNEEPGKNRRLARIRHLRSWRHAAALPVIDLCVDDSDLLVIFDAPDGLKPVSGPIHYRVVLQAVAAPIDACTSLHSLGLSIGSVSSENIVETADGNWLLIPETDIAESANDLGAVGNLLTELLTGASMGASGSLNDRPELLADGRPLPPLIDQLIASLMHPDPAARPPGLGEVAEQLRTASAMSKTSAPAPLRPPAGIAPTITQPSQSGSRPFPWGWAFLGIVVALVVLLVVFFRPTPPTVPATEPAVAEEPTETTGPAADQPTPQEQAETNKPETPEVEKPIPPTIDPKKRQAALAALESALAAIAQGEAVNAPDWAPNRWQALRELIKTGDEHLKEKNFDKSRDAYDQAAKTANDIYGSRQDAIPDLLALGNRALASGDQPGATKAFSTALAIDPTDLAADAGLKRARVLNKVNENLARGAELEAQNLYAGARIAYFAAFSLDALAPGAREAITRLDVAIADEAYLLAIKAAQKAIADDKLASAEQHIRKALDLKPGDLDATALQSQVERIKRKQAAQARLTDGIAAEQNENWQDAYAIYQEALNLDPATTKAAAGIARTTRRHELATRMQTYLDKPNTLLDVNTQRNAKLLIEEVRAIEGTETPKLHQAARELADAIQKLSMPQIILIESDGNTTISILKIKRLGMLTQKSLELLPGRYVAHGRRLGYQDVRVPFEVKPGTAAPTVKIACTVPLEL